MLSSATNATGCPPIGLNFLGGLLAHAQAAAAFTTPTVNGYKRYRPYTLAPDRAIWARDNRGVMVRVLGQPGDPSTHLENRVGEPAANPYLYMASQIYAGPRRHWRSAAIPDPRRIRRMRPRRRCCRKISAKRWPRCGRARFSGKTFGAAFVDYYAHIKEAELARFTADAAASEGDVTAWEQNEYFDLF